MILFSRHLLGHLLRHGTTDRLLVLALVFTVSACGFQLRGTLDISEDLSPVLLEKNNAFELAREIKALLRANNIQTVESDSSAQDSSTQDSPTQAAGRANTRLSLLKESKSRRVLSVDGNGRAREYLLGYTVNFSIKIKQSKQIEDSISVQRSLLFDPDAVLAVVNETEVLYKDMRRYVSRLILLKLQAHSQKVAGNSVEDGSKNQ